ncbi:Centrosomal protein of 104 kDa [Acropora cervicornis]|uniref:Centrosomal protein of 104 kDa n=1 Tax=Acropora cervicornis TaxID=6130 RepID=A0AAD9V1D9_ACRCE|nr:Centrosomal protein of 104 kDa [Acropora cervicornis]
MPSKVTFQVVYSSSSDDNHSEKELEFHSPTSKGWQSSRFCLYPQELVLLLREPTRVRKLQILSHQFLIPSKVEVLISRAPPGQTPSLSNSQFKRLGYVALSSNESTDFKARELKSIHLDFEGNFIKLVLHKNHVNKYNIYNQASYVGLIAVNIIGDPLEVPSYSQDHDALRSVDSLVQGYMTNSSTHGLIWGKINKPDFIARTDDLAFDMYQDPETATLIRKLDDKKREAVQLERYDYAKKLTAVISDLYKRQSDEFRLYVYKQLDIQELLEMKGRQPHKPINITPPPLPPIVADHSRFPLLRPEEDSRSPPLLALIGTEISPREDTPAVIRKDDIADDRLQNLKWNLKVLERLHRIQVQHAYSKQWKHRQAAMENVDREVTADTPELTADKDARKVFNASLAVLRSLVKNYIPRNKIVKSEISHVAEKPLGVIPDYATRPFKGKQQVAARMYKSRIEIIEKLIGVLKLDSGENGSLSTENIMRVKDAVRDYLPPDEPATRKNPLYRNLFDGFDRIDGKPTETERRAQAKAAAANSEKAKQAEIAALQAQLQALRDMAGDSTKASDPKPAEEEPIDVDRMCIFCGEKNETFTEEMLDMHYWKSCPMLKRCDYCAQAWSKHLKDDCAPNKARLQQQQASKAPSQASLRSSRGRGGKATPIARGAGKGRGRRRGAMPK